jgi:hypothetical protein
MDVIAAFRFTLVGFRGFLIKEDFPAIFSQKNTVLIFSDFPSLCTGDGDCEKA